MSKGDTTWHTKFIQILIDYTVIDKKTGCWLYTGYQNGRGYGRIRWNFKQYGVHRLMAIWFLGLHPNSCLEVCHSCNVRNCFCPLHIWIGTSQDNTSDMISKGRHHNNRWP